MIKDGSYNITAASTLTNVLLVGESDAKLLNTNSYLILKDSVVDGLKLETTYSLNAPVVYMDTGYNVVRNCDCVSESKPWDAAVISMNVTSREGLQEIHDCYFHGNAASRGYGHTCCAILGNNDPVYNILIHHNTFNHPCTSNQAIGGNKGKAVAFYKGRNTYPSSTYSNVHLYCNQYLGCGDTNLGVSEESCPDQ